MEKTGYRKKLAFFLPFFAAVFGAFLIWEHALADIPAGVSQVKTADSPTVYYVSKRLGIRKAYVNEASYLSYGNRWSDVRIVSASDLDAYKDVKLVKTEFSPALYYVKGKQKCLIKNESDWSAFGLRSEPIVSVSQIDLNQYFLASYQEIGLADAVDEAISQTADLQVSFLDSATSGYFLAGSADNPVMTLVFSSKKGAEISSLSFNFKGLNSGGIISRLSAKDSKGKTYDTASSVRNQDGDLRFYRDPIVVPTGGQTAVTILATGNACTGCSGQNLTIELEKALSVSASQEVGGNFPIKTRSFEIVSASGSVGRAMVKEESISSMSQGGGTRTLGRFAISQASGQDAVYVKQLEFSNSGGAGTGDLEDLRLRRDGTIISRGLWQSGRLVFPISYLRIGENNPATLEVIASLKSDYNPKSTVNLSFVQMSATGKDSSINLVPEIYNLDESITLN